MLNRSQEEQVLSMLLQRGLLTRLQLQAPVGLGRDPHLGLSVSLPEEDAATLDEYARASGLKSRSAAVQCAIRMLRHLDLEQDYAAAWDEWESSGEQAAWEGTAADGLADAAR